MLTKTAAAFFAKKDLAPPRGAKRMTARRSMKCQRGPLSLTLETSCGLREVVRDGRLGVDNMIGGTMKLVLRDARQAEPIAVKRQQVDSWREAQAEFNQAKQLCWGEE